MRALTAVLVFVGSCATASSPSQSDEPNPYPVTMTVADLETISPDEYPVEDGPTIQVTFTNFCEQPTEFGFSPDEGRPPIVWQIQPRQRQQLTIPRGYVLRGRIAGTDDWALGCLARNNQHLTFNVDCSSCTTGRDDPLLRETCMEAGTCLPP